ncbi:MAG TPA: hypothetical protein VJZ27_06760, partial [Aggregatilineales bacterium]|nr:hypothetical protein [Aggregatilineales bacterium]
MNDRKRLCFFIMPFQPALNYFFLYLKRYIEEKYPGVECKRADTSPRLGAIIDEIRHDIKNADVIVADCTGNNPNVFYELGFAHALGKQVILIAQSIADLPFDIQSLRSIDYSQNQEAFLYALDNALSYALTRRYEEYYEYTFR